MWGTEEGGKGQRKGGEKGRWKGEEKGRRKGGRDGGSLKQKRTTEGMDVGRTVKWKEGKEKEEKES